MISFLAKVMAARWLGTGRATEAYLSLMAMIAATLLLWVPNPFGITYAVPLLVKAVLSGGGLALNILGNIFWARVLRFLGGSLGSVIWAKFIILSGETNIFSGGCSSLEESLTLVAVAFCATSLLFSAREMAMALADKPRSGVENGMARH